MCNCKTRYSGGRLKKIKDTSKISVNKNQEDAKK